jgi:molybdopterin-containing oxidoreductase family membrane subunit
MTEERSSHQRGVVLSGPGFRTEHSYSSQAVRVEDPEFDLIQPILTTGKGFYLTAAALSAVAAWGLFAWLYQLWYGLGTTGLNRPVYWGIYVVNFVFFIGISHAGTLISAILRLCQAEWRRAITRSAEMLTVIALFFGVGSVILDLGRPDRVLLLFRDGNIRSPLLWDMISITAYLMISSIYLYLAMIPDIAILRDRMPSRRWFYRPLAMGWTGSEQQQRYLRVAIGVMSILVIPAALPIDSWIFAMIVQPMWHSTILGPYFAGAILSAIAALLLVMGIIRRAYHLEHYLKPVHFTNLGMLLVAMSLIWFYFTFAAHLTVYYSGATKDLTVFNSKLFGSYAPLFWTMMAANVVIPLLILINRRTRTVTGIIVASAAVTVGMWLERLTTVVPSLANTRLPYASGVYTPSWVEWSMMAGFLAMFILVYMLCSKLFPIISIWEIREGREKGFAESRERIESYLPDWEGLSVIPVRNSRVLQN